MKLKYILSLIMTSGLLWQMSSANAASRLFGAAPTSARSALVSQTIELDGTGYEYAQIAPVTMGKSGYGHQALVSKIETNVPRLNPMPRPQPEITSATLKIRTNPVTGWYGSTIGGYGYMGMGGWQVVNGNYYGGNNNSYSIYNSGGYLGGGGYMFDVCALSNQNTEAFTRLCSVTRAPEPSPALWKNTAISYFRNNSGVIATQLAKFLKDNGISSGWYKYTQKVRAYRAKGSGHEIVTMDLKWSTEFDSSRGMLFGNPTIVAEDPNILWVTYTPLKTEIGLSDAFRFPNAGTLQYEVRDSAGLPVTDVTVVNVSGAYDEPQASAEGEDTSCGSTEGSDPAGCVDENAGLRCLLDKASATGCSAGVPDVADLLDSTGSNFAIVDYMRRVKPKYISTTSPTTDLTELSDSDTVEEGEDAIAVDPNEEIAAITLNVTSREVVKDAECNQVFQNSGTFQYNLEAQIERWTVTDEGKADLVGDRVLAYITDPQPYTSSVVAAGKTGADLADLVISPMGQDCVNHPEYCIVDKSAIYDLKGLAPVVDNSGTANPLLEYLAPSSLSSDNGGMGVQLYCAGLTKEDGVRQEFFGFSGLANPTKNAGGIAFTVSPTNAGSIIGTAGIGLTSVPSTTVSVAYIQGSQSTFSVGSIPAQEILAGRVPQVNVCPGGEIQACSNTTGACSAISVTTASDMVSSCVVPAQSDNPAPICEDPPPCFIDNDTGAEICPPPVCTPQPATYSCASGALRSSGAGAVCASEQPRVFYLGW